MRQMLLILSASALAACSTAPEPVVRNAEQQAKYLRAIEGKVAGAPMNCLPLPAGNDMQVIDEQTVIFRQGSNRVYVANLNGACDNLGQPGFALVTRTPSSALCSGDIAQVMNTSAGFAAGSCVIGTFTPYTTP